MAFEPTRDEAFFTVEGQRAVLEQASAERAAGEAHSFAIVEAATEAIVGLVRLGAVARGPCQNAILGYWVRQDRNRRGYATGAVGLTLRFAFADAGLHRVQAAAMPRNAASIRVLQKNGFRREGLAERYLHIAGRWEDHAIFALTAEEWNAR